jgi:hypothetical protein
MLAGAGAEATMVDPITAAECERPGMTTKP